MKKNNTDDKKDEYIQHSHNGSMKFIGATDQTSNPTLDEKIALYSKTMWQLADKEYEKYTTVEAIDVKIVKSLLREVELRARKDENIIWNNSPKYGSTKAINDRITDLEQQLLQLREWK